ncbi:hypothetical protein Hanom_Chr12g01102751 [Helianthus anomalus]
MVNQSTRLDIQEQLIQKLQGDLTAQSSRLDSIAATLEVDRLENSEFRKMMMGFVRQQEKKMTDDGSSLFAQLEALVSRSEERLCGYGRQLMSTGPTDSRSSVFVSKLPTSRTPVASVKSKSDIIPVDRGNSAGPLFRSPSSIPNSPSLLAQSKAIMSRSEENSRGHGRLMSHRVNGLLLDKLQGTLGSEPLVGHNGELKTVVDLDYSDPGQGVEKKMVVGLIFSDLDLCKKGKVPFDRGKSSLSHRPLIGTRLKFSATSHLWVVHGQPRPPDVAVDPGLEDKTVSKGSVMIGIICLLCYF